MQIQARLSGILLHLPIFKLELQKREMLYHHIKEQTGNGFTTTVVQTGALAQPDAVVATTQ